MAGVRKKYTAEEKVKIIVEVLKNQMTMAQITSKYGVHATQIQNWKKQAMQGLSDTFSSKQAQRETDQHELVDELYKQIGQLKVELDWLKKKSELFK